MKTLLDKATTLLDTVEPDAFLVDGRIEQGLFFDKPYARIMADANCGVVVDLLSRPKVESLLTECRKQTLLEAAEDFATRGILYGYTVADQLNHKAEGEK